MSRRARVEAAIAKYGTDVVFKYLPAQNDAVDGDWPDPTQPPTLPPPADRTVRVFIWSGTEREGAVLDQGLSPVESATALIPAAEDLNEVDTIEWQGASYKINGADLYELQGEKLAQQASLVRVGATPRFPHA